MAYFGKDTYNYHEQHNNMKLQVIKKSEYTDINSKTWSINCSEQLPVIKQYLDKVISLVNYSSVIFR